MSFGHRRLDQHNHLGFMSSVYATVPRVFKISTLPVINIKNLKITSFESVIQLRNLVLKDGQNYCQIFMEMASLILFI